MSQSEKLKQSFLECRGPFPYQEIYKLLNGLGYIEQGAGKTVGSRMCFPNATTNHSVFFHKPHKKEAKASLVKALKTNLQDAGAI